MPFCTTKVPDPQLGEALVLLAEGGRQLSLASVCDQVLPRLWRPRHYITVDHLPTTETGKIARSMAQKMALEEKSNC